MTHRTLPAVWNKVRCLVKALLLVRAGGAAVTEHATLKRLPDVQRYRQARVLAVVFAPQGAY